MCAHHSLRWTQHCDAVLPGTTSVSALYLQQHAHFVAGFGARLRVAGSCLSLLYMLLFALAAGTGRQSLPQE